MTRSMTIIVTERLTDGLGLVMMTILALGGYGNGQREAWSAVLIGIRWYDCLDCRGADAFCGLSLAGDGGALTSHEALRSLFKRAI